METFTLATSETITKTAEALTANHFLPIVVATKEEALAKIKELIPEGASVMNGASRTLEEIGFIEYFKSDAHKWSNLHKAILAESDPVKQGLLRRQSVASDFYLGSAHAVTETGELMFASNSGSQLPHLAFTSPNIVLVVGTQKIVPTLQEASRRIDEDVIPLEDVRMKEVYGYGTLRAKTLILHKENPAMGRKIHVIFVNEKLGF
jgi:L-lactate utilization protein LutC